MEQITESEMLRRAAAHCSTAERCIQDVQKRLKPPALPRGRRADHCTSAPGKIHRRTSFRPLFRERQTALQQMGTHQNRIRTSKKEYPCSHPFGSAGRDRRKRICRYPPIVAEGEKEIDQRQGRTGYLHQTPPFCCRPWL